MASLKTLRATPQKGFPRIRLTYDYMEHMVKFHGRTAGHKRSEGVEDYFDIEFLTPEDANRAFNRLKGKVSNMEFSWAPRNFIKDKPPYGVVDTSFVPPKFDLDCFSELPSLPIPANQPFPTFWKLPPRQRKQKRGRQSPEPPRPAKRYPPSSVQMDEVDPRPPFTARYWLQFRPTYSTNI